MARRWSARSAGSCFAILIVASLPATLPGAESLSRSFTVRNLGGGIAAPPPTEVIGRSITVRNLGGAMPMPSPSEAISRAVTVDIGFLVYRVSPVRAGQGRVTLRIDGNKILPGGAVRLTASGHADRLPLSSSVRDEGRNLLATFDLGDAAATDWNVIVDNGGGILDTLLAAFAVEPRQESRLAVDIVGPTAVRLGRTARSWLRLRNTGNVDSPPQVVLISLSSAPELAIPALPPGLEDTCCPAVTLRDGEFAYSIVYTARLAPGADLVLPVEIRPSDAGVHHIEAKVMDGPLVPAFLAEYDAAVAEIVSTDPGMLATLSEHGLTMNAFIGAMLSTMTEAREYGFAEDGLGPDPVLTVELFFTWFKQLGKVLELLEVPHLLPAFIDAYAELGATTLRAGVANVASIARHRCDDPGAPPTYTAQCRTAYNASLASVTSMDPNEKTGPSGTGAARYVSPDALNYAVYFENYASASAAAAEIAIVDTLDGGVLDLATVELGAITIGDTTVAIPPGTRQLRLDVDLRPRLDVLARVTAGTMGGGGVVFWQMSAIDPLTGEPVEDLRGILPPNTAPPEGEGNVVFVARPRPGLSNGTEALNKASIVFDANAALVTPEWRNTFDSVPPVSQVTSLQSMPGDSAFTLEWSGSDDGSGVAEYTVFVSADGQPYEPLWEGTTETSGTFLGSFGHTYAFYSVAVDRVGNIEDAPDQADVIAVPPVGRSHPDSPVVLALHGTDRMPAIGSIRVRFSLPSRNPARIELLDISGRRLETREVGVSGPGVHVLLMGAERSLTPGVYWIRLTQDGRSIVKKTVLLR